MFKTLKIEEFNKFEVKNQEILKIKKKIKKQKFKFN